MNMIEERIRSALRHGAGSYHLRDIPAGTVRRIRVRQAISLAGSAAIVAAVFGFVMVVISVLSDPQPQRPASSPPFDSMPTDWPTVRVENPSLAFVAPPPWVDEARVLVSGTVDEAYFSLFAYVGDTEEGPCLGLAGPTVQPRGFSPGPPPDYSASPDPGGFGGMISHTCALPGSVPVPAESDLMILGQSEEGSRSVATFGFLSPRVQRLSVCVYPESCANGIDVPLFRGPRSWDGVRAFIFFPPTDREGTMVALDDRDRELARGELCSWAAGSSGGCRIESEQMATVGSVPAELPLDVPEGWPQVSIGGSDTPYVDHEVSADGDVDPGVVGLKRAIASGFVRFGPFRDVPWSLSIAQVEASDSGSPGWCLEMYVGYAWSLRTEGYRGSTVTGTCALDGQSLLPPLDPDMLVHGGVGTFRVDGTSDRWWDLEAYVGIVSADAASVELDVPSGDAVPIELRRTSDGSIGYFFFFPSPGTTGELVARDGTGTEIARWELCLPEMLAGHPNRGAGEGFGCDGT